MRNFQKRRKNLKIRSKYIENFFEKTFKIGGKILKKPVKIAGNFFKGKTRKERGSVEETEF